MSATEHPRGPSSPLSVYGPVFLASLFPLLCYWPVLGGGFLIWDDNVNLLSNPPLWSTPGAAYRWMFTDLESVQRYKPLCWLVWRQLGLGFGLEPLVFHALNLLLHAGNAVLLFSVIRRFLATRPGTSSSPAGTALAALAGCLTWALHPLRVEPTAWISGAGYPLATCFALCSVLAYQDFLRAGQRRHLAWAAFAFALSLLSYPAAAGLPALLLALVWLAEPFGEPARSVRRKRMLSLLPFALMAVLLLGATQLVRLTTSGAVWNQPVSLGSVGLGPRLMQAFAAWGWFVEKTLLPLNLAPVYPVFWQFSATGTRAVVSLFAIVALTAAAWRQRKRFPEVMIFWGAFLLLAVPFLGLTDLPYSPSDRYTYVPSLALAFLLASLLHRAAIQAGATGRKLVLGLSGLLVAGLFWVSVGQLRMWRTPVTFFQAGLASVGPNAATAADLHWRLGLHYLTMGEPGLAETEFTETLRLQPGQADAARYLRVLRQRAGHPAQP
jgi:protein O-mannosyl-transferase